MADNKDKYEKKDSYSFKKSEEYKEPEVRESQPEKKGLLEYRVLMVVGSDFILADKDGKGIRMAIPSKYKDAKKGDVIKI
jgi:hypothetical protein